MLHIIRHRALFSALLFGRANLASGNHLWRRAGNSYLSPGGGVAVEQGMRAKVHYQGRLSDGKVFDDSANAGRRSPLPLALAKSLKAGTKAF